MMIWTVNLNTLTIRTCARCEVLPCERAFDAYAEAALFLAKILEKPLGC